MCLFCLILAACGSNPATTAITAPTTTAQISVSVASITPTIVVLPDATTAPVNALPSPLNGGTVATPQKATTPGTPVATLTPSANLAEIVRGPKGRKMVAITFDAGGIAGDPPLILGTLRAHNIKLTFFLTGRWVSDNAAFARQIAADGHEIGNHTLDHPDLTKLSDADVKRQITAGEATISSITGIDPRPYFRSPYGAENKRTLGIANALGFRPVYWSLDTLDSVGAPKSTQFLIDRVTKQTDAALDGAVILIHIGGLTSAQALGPILDNLATRGFHVVTISQLIGQ